ncbi:MAG: linear amide C-N hydrolase [Clostridiales bacterium]|nr:linear amide C-N hydrolase [Clostridiales bacterium]
MKKRTCLFMAIPTCLILILGICAYILFAAQIKAMSTISKLSDDLYYLAYPGDYGFQAFLEQGGAASAEEVGSYVAEFLSHGFYKYEPIATTQGCSTISVKLPDGGYGFGRNFDWKDCTAMIVKTTPKDGYASFSTSNLNFLGFGDGFAPEGFANKLLSLAAVYVPLDGKNEKGLCVADLMIEYPEETHQETGKTALTTTTAIRLLLDKAATVDEAIALLEQYDMHSDADMMHHLAISDATGYSVVVEYINNVMYVTETQVVTNFFLTQSDVYGIGSEASKGRFEALSQLYDETSGIMDMDEIKGGLSSVRQSSWFEENWKTQWSVVYNKTTCEILFYHRENYQSHYHFKFEP